MSLVLLNLLVIEFIMAIILSPPNGLRIILGLPFVLLFRGYALVTALLIKKEGMGNIEGVTLAFGMSTVVVGLTELALNYTPWGIRLESVLSYVASFIFIASGTAWLGRKRASQHERFGIEFQPRRPGWDRDVWNKVLSIILMLTIEAVLSTWVIS